MAKDILDEFHESKQIPLKQIRRPDVLIREVKTDHPDFKNLCTNVAAFGVKMAVHVNLAIDEDNNIIPDLYDLIDGGHRFAAAQHCNHQTIKCCIAKVRIPQNFCRVYQLMLNKNRLGQTKSEEAKQFALYLAENPDISLDQLAKDFGLEDVEINRIMNLTNLIPEAAEALHNGTLNVSKAVELGRCNEKKYPGMQLELLKLVGESTDVFQNLCQERRKAYKSGRSEPTGPTPKLRPRQEIIDRMEGMQSTLETEDDDEVAVNSHYQVTRELQEQIKWVLSLDPDSILAREAKSKKKSAKVDREKKLAEENEELNKQLATLQEKYSDVEPVSV